MTLSQIMRASHWEDVSRFVKKFHQTDKLTLALYEKMFYDMQQIEPEGEGLCIQLHRYDKDPDGLWIPPRHRAKIKVEPPRQLLYYMWSRYLGAEVKDMGETKRKYREAGVCNETDESEAESCAMPDAAIAANMLCHLSGYGYSQAEVEDNIKRHIVDSAMGYNVRFIHPFEKRFGVNAEQILKSSIPDEKLVDDFLSDNDYPKKYGVIINFTTYLSTLFGWNKMWNSVASVMYKPLISSHQIDRSLMVIACPPSYELSEEAISMIQYHFNTPDLRKMVFVEDKSLTDYIRIEIFIGTYN